MRIGIGISGGVDSTVAAYLLKQAGHEVTGYTMRTSLDTPVLHEAKVAAEWLGITLKTLDFSDCFEKEILRPFADEYASGRTPSPCVWCNRRLKFGLLAESILSDGNDLVATGHYVKVKRDEFGCLGLYRGADPVKDQSYFLAQVPLDMLEHVVFPLADMQKCEVRKLCIDINAPAANRSESQDLCFIPQGKFSEIVLKYHPELAQKGKIITADGRVLGSHSGAFQYTRGQRRGIGLGGGPWFVTDVRMSENLVVVAHDGESQQMSCHLNDVKLLTNYTDKTLDGVVQIRYRMKAQPATMYLMGNEADVYFNQPVQYTTPGQLAVLYCNDQVVASGWIV